MWRHCKMFMLSRRTEVPLWYQLRSWNSEVAFLFLYQSQRVVMSVKEMYLLNALFKCYQSNHWMNVRHDNSDSSTMLLLLLLFSHPGVSHSLRPHGLQHARPPCPSPKVCPSSCQLHQFCHPAISFSDTLFSFCPQSVLVSGIFPMSTQGWFPLRLTNLISLLSKGPAGVFSNITVCKYQFFGLLLLSGPGFRTIHDHWEDLRLEYMDLFWQSNVSAFQHTV